MFSLWGGSIIFSKEGTLSLYSFRPSQFIIFYSLMKMSWQDIVGLVVMVICCGPLEAAAEQIASDGKDKPLHFVVVIATYPRSGDEHYLM